MDYIRIIALPLLKHLSGVFERMNKKVVKSKDFTQGKIIGSNPGIYQQ